MAKKQHLTISKRECKIGPSINSRTQKHGDDKVPAADIDISGVMLDRAELGKLLNNEHAWAAFFNQSGRLFEPLFPQLSYSIDQKWKESTVMLFLGLDLTELDLLDVRLNRINFVPRTGGMVELTLQVQAELNGEDMGTMHVHKDEQASIRIEFGTLDVKTKAQPELPMGDNPEDLGPNEVPGPMDVQPA